jgi:ADP-ribose pyrophosphatase YjhB (NUDIX family)
MSSPAVPNRLRRLAYSTFYRLPSSVRRRLVRLAVGKYIVGAVAVVRDSAPGPERLLLLRQPPGLGWSLPAGLLNRGERPVEGCARELHEESGIQVNVDDLRPAVPNAVVHHRGRWIDMVFEASVPAAEVTLLVDGAEVLEAGWYPVNSLPPLTGATAVLLSYYGIGPYVEYPEVRR